MFKIKLTARSKKQLKELSKSHQLVIGQIFEDLKENPLIGYPLGRELLGKFSYRVGVYRIIYKIHREDKLVSILSAGHPSKVYR